MDKPESGEDLVPDMGRELWQFLKCLFLCVLLAVILVATVAWAAGESVPWWGWLLTIKVALHDLGGWARVNQTTLNRLRFGYIERSLEALCLAMGQDLLTQEDREDAKTDLEIASSN